MYTVIWREGDIDKWDRFATKEEVMELLQQIDNNPDACCIGDVWVFSPEADEHALTGSDFIC